MRKLLKATIVFVLFFGMKTASAQNNFISHILKAGETLSLLAKEYNTNVGDIMRLNNMHADSKLVYGSAIKIPSAQKIKTKVQQAPPVKQINVAVNKNAVKHTVVKGETLYSISKQFNVTTEQLRAWNNLTDNSVKLGSDLIVGANNSSTQTNTATQIKRQRIESSQPLETNNIIQPEQKTEPVTVSNVVEEKNVDNADVKTTNETQNNETAYNITNTVLPGGAGYFENQFTGKIKRKKHISGISKTFKTSSGWSDAKYYILADDINPGTIVKLTADNGKSVYAKVLWNMGDLKENNGINFRISNATAAALNENAASFNLTVYY